VLAGYYSKAEIVKRVPRTAFRPAPKIESAIVRLVPKGVEKDKDLFFVTKVAFMHRNKKLLNALMDSREHLKVKDKEQLRQILPRLLGKLGDKKVFYLEIEELQEVAQKLKDRII
jgi:16S rRNA (adenine1518-N6/adenine1519-N6)-dimethyltransferase